MSKPIILLDSRGNPIARERSAPRSVAATYDESKWTWENAKQWSNVDQLSARAANSREVRRRLYTRARYERANNSYADGIVTTLADDTVGTGPHLHMETDDEQLNGRIEEAWDLWATQIHLAIKLHTMRQSLCVDGEAFGLLNTNPAIEGPVQLDVKLIEADQIQTPWLNPIDPLAVDGIRYDIYFNPIEYSMLRYHPGDYFQIGYIADPIDARAMLHWFKRTRPGQCRGIPELTPALPLLPLLRRYTLAVLGAAEAAADFAAVLYSELPPDVEGTECEPFEHLEIERRTMMTLPAGYKVGQIDPKQPAPSYDSFKNQILREVGRVLRMPFHKVAGDASGYNYSSARLDDQGYYEAIEVDQFQLVHWVLDPLFRAWLVEMSLASNLLRAGPSLLSAWKHTWFFPGHGYIDPKTEAQAEEIRLKSNTTTLAEIHARQGRDWEGQIRQRAKELALCNELGLPAEPPKTGEGFGGGSAEAGWALPRRIAMPEYVMVNASRNGHGGRIAAFNEHHDELGRFSESDSSGGDKESGTGKKEKAHPSRGEMKEARREGTGKDARIIMRDGSPVPGHIRPGMVSPKWTDVQVSVDPKAEVLVTALDSKGRPKMVTSKTYDARSAAVKWGRTDDMLKEHDTIAKEIQAARKDPSKREEADCAWLMQVQATRPGSERDTKADVKAYGATTLEARHIVETHEGVRLQFIGKEGIAHDHLVRDPELASMLLERKEAAGSPDAKIFRTDDKKMRAFTRERDHGGFTPKDFRTGAATKMAMELIAADPRPSVSIREHKARIKDVATKVSDLLGNEPAEARDSYIHPAVWMKWSVKRA